MRQILWLLVGFVANNAFCRNITGALKTKNECCKRDFINFAIQKYGDNLSSASKVAANAMLGGIVSEIGGGKFACGAMMGAFTMMYNELMHEQSFFTKCGKFRTNITENIQLQQFQMEDYDKVATM